MKGQSERSDVIQPRTKYIPLRVRRAVWIKTCLVDNSLSHEADMEDLGLSSASNESDEGVESCTTLASEPTDWMTWDDVSVRNAASHILNLFNLW